MKKAEKKRKDNLVFVAAKSLENQPEELKINWLSFVTFFNNLVVKLHSNCDPVNYLSKGMKARIQGLVNAWGTKQVLIDACEKMLRSDFLNGRRKGYPFKASLYWLVSSDEKFEKVLSGMFDNPPVQEQTLEERRKQAAEERAEAEKERKELAKSIDEQEHEALWKRMAENERNKATPEELERIFARIGKHIPPAAPKSKTKISKEST